MSYEEPPSIPQLVGINNKLAKNSRQLQAKIDELKKALEKYSVHKDDCNLMLNEHLSVCDSKCTCGLKTVLGE